MTGLNQIINADCMDIMKFLDKDKCILVSDPPFNINYHYNTYSDNLEEDEYYNWLVDIFGEYKHILIHYPECMYKYAFTLGMFPDKLVSWVYNSMNQRQHRDIAFFGITPDFNQVGQPYKNPTDKRILKRIANGESSRLYDWWHIEQVKNVSKEKTIHPCQMPLKVMKNIVGMIPDDYIIVDPFSGSGTTAIACIDLNRNYICIEKDKDYYEASLKRVEKELQKIKIEF